ncbi:hypothetical protein Tco_0598157 [Tanacetum coccineum]
MEVGALKKEATVLEDAAATAARSSMAGVMQRRSRWCCSGAWDGDGGSGVMMVVELWWVAVGRQPEEKAARGCE